MLSELLQRTVGGISIRNEGLQLTEIVLITVAPLEFRKLYNERVLRSLEAAEYGDQVIRLLDPNQRTFVLPYKLCATWFVCAILFGSYSMCY